ncbi:MAG: agmatine deiminase family protein [Candidatus Cloacimonetes bacterium]|nr:agmatine deiminase family protein [Candidatus Cloacimonadota bacterium]
MKKVIITALFLISSIMLFADNMESENNWLKDNPSLGHWLSYEESQLQVDLSRDFYPTDPPPTPVRNIAEFEPMEGVLIRYPFGINYNLIAEMSQETGVTTIVLNQSQEDYVTNIYNSNGVNMANCNFLHAPSDSYWTRDYGPWYVADGNNQVGIVNFPYNRPRPNDNDIPIEMAAFLEIELFGMDLIHTGGNYMTDGMGISASTDLVISENPGLTIPEIDQFVLDYLGIETYHKVPDPNNTYIDHIDCWGKYLDVDKILIREVPVTHPQYDEIEATAAYFAAQTSSYGTLYEVYRVNTPNDQPYTNSLILNDRVFVPITGNAAYDNAALQVYEDAMPGYEVLGFTGSWQSTDALHCRTKGIADRNMLYIRHIPIQGEQPQRPNYEIEAEIIPYSGQPVYSDSLLIYYKVDGGEYTSVNMTLVEDFTYEGIIPSQPEGTEVAYYIHAADESGQSRNHPFIGAPDPYIFIAGPQAPAELIVDPASFDIEMNPDEILTEYMELKNIGDIILNYSISLSDPVDWMSLDPMSGSIAGSDSVNVEITFDSSDLIPDEYTCNIIITDDREETIVPVTLTVAVSSAKEELLLNTTQILSIYPNPFNPSTIIKFSTTEHTENTELIIYNIKGQKVKTLSTSPSRSLETRSVVWNGTDENNKPVSSGIYFAVLNVNNHGSDYTSVKKLILLK